MEGDRGGHDEDVRALVLREEVRDLRAAVEEARTREKRHWAVAAFGLSPSVVAVAAGLFVSGSWELIAVFSVIVLVVESVRAQRAGREAWELGARLEALEERLEGGPTPPPGDGRDGPSLPGA